MSSKIEILAALHKNLFSYIKEVTERPGMPVPTLSEMILYLQSNEIDVEDQRWSAEFKQKYPADYEKFTQSHIEKIKKYINAMLELLRN